MLMQILSVIGAFCLLYGYYLSSISGIDKQRQLKSILLNTLGSGVLTYTAIYAHQYGFIILEGTWCIISIKNLYKHYSD